MNNIKCSSPQCLGGALVIFNSKGSIDSSYFTNNYCQSDGGAIGIVNLNGNTTISKTEIKDNVSDGNGGGLLFITNLSNNVLAVT